MTLSFAERLRRLRGRPPDDPPQKILFVKLIEMGSTVLACPAFAAAARMVGEDNIYILVFAQNRAIVDLLPYFPDEQVITIADQNLAAFCRDLPRALARVRELRIDTAVDLEGLTRSSAIITWLTGAVRRVGYHNFTAEGPYRGRLFTHELTYTFQHHVSRMFLSLALAAGRSSEDGPLFKERVPEDLLTLPVFEPTPAEQVEVRRILSHHVGEDPGRPLILLNPNTGDQLPIRQWPEERFVELGRRLLEIFPGATLAVTGTEAERGGSQRVARAIGPVHQVVSVAGDTTLRQLLTLYTLADLLVSSDCGPGHFASLTSVSVVSLFGPETPMLYAPMGDHVQTLWAGLACSPCVNILNHRLSNCSDNQCMKDISVDQVVQACRRALEHRLRPALAPARQDFAL